MYTHKIGLTSKQMTALVAVSVIVLAVAGPILADLLQAHQAQAQRWWRGHRWWGPWRHGGPWWRGHPWRGTWWHGPGWR